MANEFHIKRGFVSEGDGTITGSLQVTGTVSGSFEGDGSQLTGFNFATFTVELIDSLSATLYAPYDLKINSSSSISGSGTTTISVNDSSYTIGNTINQGNKIAVSTDNPIVINLNIEYE